MNNPTAYKIYLRSNSRSFGDFLHIYIYKQLTKISSVFVFFLCRIRTSLSPNHQSRILYRGTKILSSTKMGGLHIQGRQDFNHVVPRSGPLQVQNLDACLQINSGSRCLRLYMLIFRIDHESSTWSRWFLVARMQVQLYLSTLSFTENFDDGLTGRHVFIRE